MGRVLVIYDSETGNTEKMAHLVAEGARKFPVEVRVKHVKEATKEDIVWADGIAVGSPPIWAECLGDLKSFSTR